MHQIKVRSKKILASDDIRLFLQFTLLTDHELKKSLNTFLKFKYCIHIYNKLLNMNSKCVNILKLRQLLVTENVSVRSELHGFDLHIGLVYF